MKLKSKTNKLINDRNTLFGQTCEQFAEEKSFLDRTLRCLFSDEALTQPIFELGYESIGDTDEGDLAQLFFLIQGLLANFSENKLQRVAISEFFQGYFSLCDDNIYNFYGKPIVALTFYQTRLASWGRTFKFLLSEYESQINDEILEEPSKLIDHHWAQENQRKEMDRRQQKGQQGNAESEFVSYIGAKSSEVDEMHSKSDSSIKKVNLWEKAAEKEGGLGMMDFIEIQEGKKYKY